MQTETSGVKIWPCSCRQSILRYPNITWYSEMLSTINRKQVYHQSQCITCWFQLFYATQWQLLCQAIVASGVYYLECATHIVVVESPLSRFDITEYYAITKAMKPWMLCLHCPISVLIQNVTQRLQRKYHLIKINYDIQAHIQGWLWYHIWKEMLVLLLCALHTPCNVLLVALIIESVDSIIRDGPDMPYI